MAEILVGGNDLRRTSRMMSYKKKKLGGIVGNVGICLARRRQEPPPPKSAGVLAGFFVKLVGYYESRLLD